MKRILFLLTAILISANAVFSQETNGERTFGVSYISELQSNTQGNINFLNQLRLNAKLPLGKRFAIEGQTISFAKSRENSIADDEQGFSNIEADNIALTLAVLDLEWKINEFNTLEFGIRNMNDDYFISEVTSLFTNSSCGVYPTIANNYPIANYPETSLGMHYVFKKDNYELQASIYNGVASYKFIGRNNMFRFCPESDGIFALTQGEYRNKGSRYFAGLAIHHGELSALDSDILASTIRESDTKTTLWAYAEQRITDRTNIIAGYSHAFHSSNFCTDFVCLGFSCKSSKWELGLFADLARMRSLTECAIELTAKYTISDKLYLQPAIHLIHQDDYKCAVGLLRFGVEI